MTYRTRRKLILCFDFDLTLSTTNTLGYPMCGDNYFTEQQKYRINRLFAKVKKDYDCGIFIITRADRDAIVKYIENKCPFMNAFIDRVYGSGPQHPMYKMGNYWPNLKVKILKSIKDEFPNWSLLFFDDTLENVAAAIRGGFEAYLVKDPAAVSNIVIYAINHSR